VLPLSHRLRTLLLAAGALVLGVGAASAQGSLEAHYTASIAGIPIGKGTWVVDIADTHYSAAASGVTTGLVRVFIGGEGTSATRGVVVGGQLISSVYASTIKTRFRTDEVRFTLSHGDVKDAKLDPPQDKDPERVPLTQSLEHGVLDPMTASLLQVPGSGSLLTPDACARTLAVFDGRLRYDLRLAYKRMDAVKAKKGYAGPVLVCTVYFSPIAGYIPSRATIRYLRKLHDIEVWLAPIAGTRVLAPFLIQGPTPIGEGRLAADQFVSKAMPTRASSNGLKVQ
jgi:Protein of unknown function (DUF3108)